MTSEKDVQRLITEAGGTLHEIGALPDGSGFATASFPLPKDHWLYANGYNVPPMPLRMGCDDPRRQEFNEMVCAAARYAIRASTMNGKHNDFDPDAMVQNMVVGLLGYHTDSGLSDLDDWANPKPVPLAFAERFDGRSNASGSTPHA